MLRSIPRSVLDVMEALRPAVADRLDDDLTWHREDEQDINAIRPPDDEAFLDEQQDNLGHGDLLFSDGFPLIADDNTKSGRATHTRQPFMYVTTKEVLKLRIQSHL